MLPNLKIKQKITSLALFVFVVLVPQYSHASVGPDLEIVELVTPSLTSTESSASIQIVIRNNGDVDANFTDYAICMTGDAPQACETTVTNIEAGSTDTLTLLSTLNLSSGAPYNVTFYTSMVTPDANPANDTLKVLFNEKEIGADLEIVELVTPSLTSTESSASIQIVIRNNGDVDANFTDYAICITGDAPQSCETTVTNIEAGSTDTLTLLSTLDLSSKPYNVIFYTSMLAPDANPANDTLKVMFDIALATNSLNNVSAVNVYPNPSNGIIYVDLEGLNSASVIVRAITGELVFQETDINSPLYEINMNGEVGLYLIEVSSEGHQAITKVLLK